jgi:hypothetical protein
VPSPVAGSLFGALAAVTAAFDDAGVPAVVVGGVAVSLLGRPRFTRDIDALVDLQESRWPELIAAAERAGIVPRIEDALEFASRSRVLLLRHAPSQIDIDVILGGLPFERSAVEAAQPRSVGGVTVRLPRVEDLMIMKAVAQRPQDMLDLEGLIAAHPQADLTVVRQWVREFSSAAAMPSLLEDFDRLARRMGR